MNLQEVINAINEEWEKKIADIKTEIRQKREAAFKEFGFFETLTYDECLYIIDKHISGKENK